MYDELNTSKDLTMKLANVDVDLLIGVIASSDGDTQLASERLSTKLGMRILSQDLEERIAQFDIQSSDKLSAKFRTLLTVKLYNLIHQCTISLLSSIDELRPSELAKTHASLTNSFTSLTAPAAKITFDFDAEIAQLASEFPEEFSGMSVDDMRAEIKRYKDLKLVK